MEPPLQEPWPQSTICCSERLYRVLWEFIHMPFMAPVAEKAQQEPHWPWFFTGVTLPSSLKSMWLGAALSKCFLGMLSRFSGARYPSILSANSSWVQSDHSYIAIVHS